MTENQPRARVGTSAWDKDRWQGQFYPLGLAKDRRLRHASAQLTTLEINTTFYGGGSPSSFRTWREETPHDFVFSVKGPGAVTHDQLLRNPAQGLASFFAKGILSLEEKLGPVLWQTPPHLVFQPDVVDAFLSALPRSIHEAQQLIEQYATNAPAQAGDAADRPIRHALEVRHNSFQNPAFIEMLRQYGIAAVVTNSPGWPHFREVTADFVYLRLHSDAKHYPNGYEEATLREWAALIDEWRSGTACPDNRGRDAFVYFDNPDHSGNRAPFDAMHLQDMLGGPGDRERPTIYTQPSLW